MIVLLSKNYDWLDHKFNWIEWIKYRTKSEKKGGRRARKFCDRTVLQWDGKFRKREPHREQKRAVFNKSWGGKAALWRWKKTKYTESLATRASFPNPDRSCFNKIFKMLFKYVAYSAVFSFYYNFLSSMGLCGVYCG